MCKKGASWYGRSVAYQDIGDGLSIVKHWVDVTVNSQCISKSLMPGIESMLIKGLLATE